MQHKTTVYMLVASVILALGVPAAHTLTVHTRPLPAALLKAKESDEAAHALDVVKQLKAINAASLQILNEARQTGNGELVLKAVDRVQRQVELQAKLLGELDDRPQVNVLLAPEWVTVRTALLGALGPYPEARAAVAQQLLALEGSNGHHG